MNAICLFVVLAMVESGGFAELWSPEAEPTEVVSARLDEARENLRLHTNRIHTLYEQQVEQGERIAVLEDYIGRPQPQPPGDYLKLNERDYLKLNEELQDTEYEIGRLRWQLESTWFVVGGLAAIGALMLWSMSSCVSHIEGRLKGQLDGQKKT